MIIAPFQDLFDGGFITRGCAALYPGLSHFTPSGLRNQRPSFFVKAGKPRILKERMDPRIREVDFKAGAKSKVANGVVAVGLPHRNYSALKQTP